MSDYSIDYILNRAGERYTGTNSSLGISQRFVLNGCHPYMNLKNPNNVSDAEQNNCRQESHESIQMLSWLHYTRYHPPKLPRALRPVPAKRTPGRLPRIPFTPTQLEALESAYQVSNYLSAEGANKLAESLELTNTRVKIWFQNRRARERREKREREENFDNSTISSTESDVLEIVQ